MNLREFLLKDRIFSKSTPFEQAMIMNELDSMDTLAEEYNSLVLEKNRLQEEHEYLKNKFRLMEKQLFKLKEREEKRYRGKW